MYPEKPHYYQDSLLVLSLALEKMVFKAEKKWPKVIPGKEKAKLEGAQKLFNEVRGLLSELNDIRIVEASNIECSHYHARMAIHKLKESYPKRK